MLMKTIVSAFAHTIQPACVALSLASTVLLAVMPPNVAAQDAITMTEHSYEVQAGEVIYVPVYTRIYQTEKKASKQPLSSTLAIHNVDPSSAIHITSVRYYDHAGAKLKDYIDAPRSLGPFASANFVVDITEDRGGVGANFIVEWQAAEKVVSPIVEAIMIGGSGTQGLSFVTRGKVIETRP
ncbi:MAG: hypothetical protein N838_25140 [Thiohalocapsa sp. PB-PSB1]|jgi:hypothetical protein|nr:MAG: hypothetical protein N838_25140 [Thiohalocapsa sp. PB-PSB1]